MVFVSWRILRMGIHPKIGITGLPRSGKSAVMEKVLSMLKEERERELSARNLSDTEIIGGICTEPILENGERLGYKVRNLVTGDEGEIAHKSIDSRLRVLGYGLNTAELERIAIPAIQHAIDNCEVIVIDEIGKFAVESEAFVNAVRNALEIDKPTLLTLHKKSRHPLLQDIRRRDDGRILEVTPVNRALLPYKIHKLMRETY
ncbi:nucleotide kinase [Euryarchaeota archaeon]|nr:nucleotide kinase [Euryarchaeota archaeon]